MTNRKMAEAMRLKWADPEWRERQRALIMEAFAKKTNGSPRTIGARTARGVNKITVSVSMPEEMFAALRALAVAERRSLSEVVRRFVQWGLDVEGADED